MKTTTAWLQSVLILSVIGGCSGKQPDTLRGAQKGLSPCPDRPNCVSTTATQKGQKVLPFQINGDPAEKWALIKEHVAHVPRWTLMHSDATYLHVECRSKFLGFVDDLELEMDPKNGMIAIRSASRLGYSDLGVNRKRVETLRQELSVKGLIQ